MKRFLFIILIMMFTYCCKSQKLIFSNDSIRNKDAIDTTKIENLITKYYKSKDLSQRSYNYELANEKRKLKEWSKRVHIAGLGFVMAISATYVTLHEKNNWSLVWMPAEITIGTVGMILFYNWSKKIRNKADAIKLNPVYTYNLNNNTSIRIYTSSFNEPRSNIDGLCIGISTNF